MHPLFADVKDAKYFIDDIGMHSFNSFEEHLRQLLQVVLRLERNGFIANPFKVRGIKQLMKSSGPAEVVLLLASIYATAA